MVDEHDEPGDLVAFDVASHGVVQSRQPSPGERTAAVRGWKTQFLLLGLESVGMILHGGDPPEGPAGRACGVGPELNSTVGMAWLIRGYSG
jgi:hypothetical protein